MTQYNSYYGPHLPSGIFARFVAKYAQYADAHSWYRSYRQELHTSFHVDVTPDEFASLLKLTRADPSLSKPIGRLSCSTLTINEMDGEYPLLLSKNAVHFYVEESA